MIVPLAAEPVAHIGSFVITNSMLNTWIALGLFIILALVLRSRRALVPRGIQNFVETILEMLIDQIEKVTNDRARARRFLPIVGSLFVFILVSNWMGLIPGVGTIGVWGLHEGHVMLIPLFRAATSDLNTTLALAVLAVVSSHILGIMAIGFFRHAGKFIQLGGIWKSLRKGPVAIFAALIEFFVGILELIGEVAKMLSLSLRLFGNVFAGEVLLTVIAGLIAYAAPLPFIFLELIVGVVQATVFSMLTLVYLTVATEPPHGEEGHDEAHNGSHEASHS